MKGTQNHIHMRMNENEQTAFGFCCVANYCTSIEFCASGQGKSVVNGTIVPEGGK